MARPKKIKELNENVIGNPEEVVTNTIPSTEINGEVKSIDNKEQERTFMSLEEFQRAANSAKFTFTDNIITVRRYYDENRGFYNFIFEDSMGICLFFVETTDSDFNTWKSVFLKEREAEIFENKTEYKFKLIIEK